MEKINDIYSHQTEKTLIEERHRAVLYKRIKTPEPERPDPDGEDHPDPKPQPKPNPKPRKFKS